MNILEKAQVNCKNIIEKNLNIDKNQNVILIYAIYPNYFSNLIQMY